VPGEIRRRLLDATARRLGIQFVRRTYYSPIPDVREIPSRVWERRSPLRGLAFDLSAQLGFVEAELTPYLEEFRPPLDRGPDPGEYYSRNGFYNPGDAELLYALVRHLKPRRIAELGSGYSTAVAARACRRNVAEGHEVTYEAFDPYPRDWVEGIPGLTALHSVPATRVPLETIGALDGNDILFVDTTHTVKVGGDVNHIILDLLPLVEAGVAVHFHDVFLPWEYPRRWVGPLKRYWAEQYLLQAFLAGNSGFEVLLAVNALVREHGPRLRELIPSISPELTSCAFWIRRVKPATP
jgi:hypothetical protein